MKIVKRVIDRTNKEILATEVLNKEYKTIGAAKRAITMNGWELSVMSDCKTKFTSHAVIDELGNIR